jgi:hypothetical protein
MAQGKSPDMPYVPCGTCVQVGLFRNDDYGLFSADISRYIKTLTLVYVDSHHWQDPGLHPSPRMPNPFYARSLRRRFLVCPAARESLCKQVNTSSGPFNKLLTQHILLGCVRRLRRSPLPFLSFSLLSFVSSFPLAHPEPSDGFPEERLQMLRESCAESQQCARF